MRDPLEHLEPLPPPGTSLLHARNRCCNAHLPELRRGAAAIATHAYVGYCRCGGWFVLAVDEGEFPAAEFQGCARVERVTLVEARAVAPRMCACRCRRCGRLHVLDAPPALGSKGSA